MPPSAQMNRPYDLAMERHVRDVERLRERLLASGGQVAEQLLPVLAAMAGPLFAGMDALVAVDFGSTEPFDPARRLVADVATPRATRS